MLAMLVIVVCYVLNGLSSKQDSSLMQNPSCQHWRSSLIRFAIFCTRISAVALAALAPLPHAHSPQLSEAGLARSRTLSSLSILLFSPLQSSKPIFSQVRHYCTICNRYFLESFICLKNSSNHKSKGVIIKVVRALIWRDLFRNTQVSNDGKVQENYLHSKLTAWRFHI